MVSGNIEVKYQTSKGRSLNDPHCADLHLAISAPYGGPRSECLLGSTMSEGDYNCLVLEECFIVQMKGTRVETANVGMIIIIMALSENQRVEIRILTFLNLVPLNI